MGFFGKLLGKKEEEKNMFGDTGAGLGKGALPGAEEDPFGEQGKDPFADLGAGGPPRGQAPGEEFGFPKSRADIGLGAELARPAAGAPQFEEIHRPQPVPAAPAAAMPSLDVVGKDIEVMSSKLDALRSNIESLSIKMDHIENLIMQQAESSKRKW